jgi:cell division protein FtsN
MGRSDGRVELSAGGVIMLAVATLVATGLVFLLGIYVGKGITEERLVSEQRVVRLPAGGDEAPQERSGEVELSFWDRLSDEEAAPAAATPAATPTEAPVRVVPPSATAPTAVPTPTVRPTPVPTPRPTPVPTAPPAAALRGTFQVQVQALSDRAAADRLVRDLRAKGYDVRVSTAEVGGKTLYRVRVGPFATEEAARAAIERLKGEGFPEAFLAAGE